MTLLSLTRHLLGGDHALAASRSLLSLALAAAVSLSAGFADTVAVPVYSIKAGDNVNIQVIGHPEWSSSLTVRPDGRITYPATGEIEVAGLTVEKLTEQIEYALGPGGRHLRNPRVIINVTGIRTPSAHLLGAVTRAGAVELPTGVGTALMMLNHAGGASPSADLTRVTIYRRDGSQETVNLEAQRAGEAEHTVVGAGDVLMVPEIKVRYVGVLGAVGGAGEIALEPHQTSIDMLELLVRIRGVGAQADRERAMILRTDGSIDSFMVDRVLTREVKVELRAGDVLWVPQAPPEPAPQHFSVTGAVRSAGRFELREGLTLADALALSGELSEAADPERITVIRAGGEKEILDVRPMLLGHDTEVARWLLEPDDIILVPARDKSYALLGAIGGTGFFPWEEELRLADVLTKAGGIRSNAAGDRVALIRRTGDGAPPMVVQLNAEKLLLGENEAANWKIMPGDTIYVPPREERRTVRQMMSEPLSILGIIGAVERVLRWW